MFRDIILLITSILVIILSVKVFYNNRSIENFNSYNYTTRTGYCIPGSGTKSSNIGDYQNITLDQAREKCDENENCRGITYNSNSKKYLLKNNITGVNNTNGYLCYTKSSPKSAPPPQAPLTIPNNITDVVKNIVNQQYNMDIEAIRNLGAISKSLLTGKNYHSTNTATPGTLTIPGHIDIEGNMNVKGWANAIPIGTVIMWALDSPPPPNTTNWNGTSYPDDNKNKWYPCIGGIKNQINIPDLRSRFPVGMGGLDGKNNVNVGGLRTKTDGKLPLKVHDHPIGSDGNHQHNIELRYNHEGHMGDNKITRSFKASAFTDRHPVDWPHNFNKHWPIHHAGAHSHGGKTNSSGSGNYYTKDTLPFATVMQYWIRIR